MTDSQRCSLKQNIFSLIRLKPDCRIHPTSVDFSPLFASSASNGSILPVFNDDRCYFTPAFLLSSDKKTQAKSRQSEKMQFEHRMRLSIQSLTSKKNSAMAPSSNYCHICQSYFKNYDLHIEQKTHILRCHHNEFNSDIEQLCSLVEEPENVLNPSSKRKIIKKRDCEINSMKNSPKTADNYPKRKKSFSCEQSSITGSVVKQTPKI